MSSVLRSLPPSPEMKTHICVHGGHTYVCSMLEYKKPFTDKDLSVSLLMFLTFQVISNPICLEETNCT